MEWILSFSIKDISSLSTLKNGEVRFADSPNPNFVSQDNLSETKKQLAT
ncbi:hypothetical protein [Pedobacter psychrophilus]|nr:hypothetical protein [Pedobacter psychrophilus]